MSNHKARVLVVDDDDDILTILGTVIESWGYLVSTAEDGGRALEILRGGERADLILLDMMMPDVNGWQFRAEQHRDPELSEIPVVVLTGDGRAEEKAAEIGVVGVLKKPVEIDELQAVVERFLGPVE